MKIKGRRQSKNVHDKRTPFGIPDRKKNTFQSAAISTADSLGGNIKDAMKVTPKMEKIGDKVGRSGMDEAAKKDSAEIAKKKYSPYRGKGPRRRNKI